jgi:hypothetical protein
MDTCDYMLTKIIWFQPILCNLLYSIINNYYCFFFETSIFITCSICLCILMILLCKFVFTDQESNVHYYLFSHDRFSLTIEHHRLLFVIISIIVDKNQTLENHHDNRKRIFLFLPLLNRTSSCDASIRWLFSSSLFENAYKHTYRFRKKKD